MADQASEKLNIRLHAYDEDITVSVPRDEEELYRRAAKFITERFNVYAQMFSGKKSKHTIALMTLIDIALQLEKEKSRNDTAPYDTIMKTLAAEIDEALGESV